MSNSNSSPSFDDKVNNFNSQNGEGSKKDDIIINKPKISKKTASMIVQYGMIGFTVIGIFYKMFIEDTSGSVKKQPIQQVVKKEENFADVKIDRVKKSNISEKQNLQEIVGIDTGFKAKNIMNVELPPLTLPKVPEIEIEEKIEKKKKEEPPLVLPTSSPLERANQIEAKTDKIDNIANRNDETKNAEKGTSVLKKDDSQVNLAMGEMFLVKGSGGGTGPRQSQEGGKESLIVLNGANFSVVENGVNSKINAKKITNLGNTLLTGKMLEAVLETAINTEMPGTVRAVVSRDVFAESGSNILIPAGSRLYGTYTASLGAGETRLGVMWNRLVRPDAISISINAQATDESGQAGITGDVDNGYFDMFKNSMLLSFISLGTAIATQKLFDLSGQSQVVNSNGSIATTNITPANAAMQNVVNLSSNISKQITSDLSQNIKTRITVPQGHLIKISVNQDLVLPTYIKNSL